MTSRSFFCIAAILFCCSVAYGATVTFDEVQPGTELDGPSYPNLPRIWFGGGCWITNHKGSTWGTPNSGDNVLIMTGGHFGSSFIAFGLLTSSEADYDQVQSVSGYFSTDTGRTVRITAYHSSPGVVTPAATTVIGAPDQSWTSRYIEIASAPDLPIHWLVFEGVNSPDDLLGFCLDDLTITCVPEPSSLLALAGGILGMGLAVRRRRAG